MTLPFSEEHKLAVFVDGIGSPELTLWHDALGGILQDNNSVLFNIADLSESDTSFISKYAKIKAVQPSQDLEPNLEQFETFFFANTVDSIFVPDWLGHKIRKVCLFGGLNTKSLSKQLSKVFELKFDYILSDVLPDEIQSHLDPKQSSQFEKSFLFLPPKYENNFISSNSSEKILFVHLDHEDAIPSTFHKVFRNTIEKLDHARTVNLNNIPTKDWIEVCNPGSECKVVIADVKSPSFLHYLSELCLSKKINYHSLNTKYVTSPVRTYFTNNLSLTDWLKEISTKHHLSFRQKFLDIITPAIVHDNATKDKPLKNDYNYSTTIRNYLLQKFLDETDHRLESIRKFYQEGETTAEICTSKSHYLSNPTFYLLQNEPNAKVIETALRFYAKYQGDGSSLRCLKYLIECHLILASSLVQDSMVVNQYYRLFSISPKTFTNSFVKNFLGNRNEKSYLDQAATILQMVQRRNIDKKDRDLFLYEFLKLPLPNNLQTRALLGNAQLDLFEISIKKMWSESSSDGAGASVIDFLHQNEDFKNETLKYLKKCCEEEISKGYGQLRSHISLGIINILLNEKFDVSKNLSNPEQPRNDFKNFPFIWHEIALFSLSQGRLEETSNLLKSTIVTEKDKAFSMIGEIAILILLKEFNKVIELLKSFPRNLLSDLWNPRFPLYYTAFYLSVIFKFNGKVKAFNKTTSIMDQDLMAIDSRFRPLLDNIECVSDYDSSIHEIMDLLEYSL